MAHIVVTRPQGKGEALAELLIAAGHRVSTTPVLQIDYLSVDANQLATLDEADIAIFVSQDAVQGLYQQRDTLPANLACFAVGPTTAQALEQQFSCNAKVPKKHHDSEGLLKLPELQQVEGKTVVLIKGRGGRTLIAKTLKDRGAFVNSLVTYERKAVKGSSKAWLQQWQQQGVEALVITSNSGADAIFACQDESLLQWLKSRQFYIVSERTKAHLVKLGVKGEQIKVAADVDNEAIAACIGAEQEGNMSEQPKNTPKSEPAPSATQPKAVPSQSKPMTQKISKTAVLALLVALAAAGVTGYQYWLQQQAQDQEQNQLQQHLEQLQSDNQALNQRLEALANALQQQQHSAQQWQRQFSDRVNGELSANQRAVAGQIEQAIDGLNNQEQPPLDINEVKRLVAMADFQLWSEANYAGAAATLKRLDALLASYPGNAQLRRAIHIDLQQLASIEVADVEAVVLRLHGLGGQVDKLQFTMVELAPTENNGEQSQALSDNVSDWRRNLAATWDKLVDDFIKVRKREAAIEPLLDNQQQRLIKQRLHFYLDQAGFAASHKHPKLYTQALQSAADIVTRYFNLQQPQTSQFLGQLKQLQLKTLVPQQPITLSSVQVVGES
ncbi:uroporphyrinogen-III synthase [Pseudoalteromonas ruthenica]|uniref:uroporphyrinogen-III synthase n=1 Tax=Pseudoalteromonas ruthenica TaxID=151081 RepID=UPI00110BBB00|nr:uroporphyrinogen-III synthase [Pseudoalteromonas ruthenica]TMO48523.1 uroporphyrinogen-III synthase [Pseudoalteromonas ruthenica]TMO50259.1 uroporphyrinogen-III synthase [Pseudoalteromonas ruthenica]